ncbi:hypothetical protein GOP47_0026587 [Adiantum capillus-veneris]|nr:hypothetical protein GOP47_0026587 [Adiantum capillus-veneris]
MEEMGEDWENCCPLCMEEMDSTDRQLKPCRCGYQICVWCWNHIMEMAEKDSTEGRCPACRTPYDKEKIVSTAVSCDRLGDINEKKQKLGKAKTKAAEGRKNLSNVRVIQRNLVYVVGIPAALADEETLERKEYFGQYGKILKISVSKTGSHSSQHSSAGSSVSVYVTYVKEEDAMRCIQSVNGYVLDGKVLKACFGTTKYCNAWLKHMPCNNPDCLYLHDEGTREDSFTKEEMLAKYGSKNQHFHDLTHPPQRRSGVGLPPPVDAPSFSSTSSISQNVSQNAPTVVGSAPKAVPLVAILPKSSSLPAAASWGSRSSASSRSASSRSVVGPSGSKPKTGAGLINLATVSGSCISGQSVNNYDGVKHPKASNVDGAQTSFAGASGLVERNHSAAETSELLQMEAFTSDADDTAPDKDISRQVFDGLISHRKNVSGAEANDHMYGASRETKILDSVSSHKLADVEESSGVVNISAGLTRLAPPQDACLKSPMGLLASMPIASTCIDQEDSGILKEPGSKSRSGFQLSQFDCSTDSGLHAGSEVLPRKPESALRQEVFIPDNVHLVLDNNDGSQRTIDMTASPPSNMTGLTILSRSDQATAIHSSHPTEAHEDIPCSIPSRDLWSNSVQTVNSDEQVMVQAQDSLFTQRSAWKDKGEFENLKEPVNGLSEHELISDMFSTGFDLWNDGSPQDLAQLLFNGKKVGFPSKAAVQESTTSWKPSSGSKQSRFHFARQDEVNEQTLCSNKLLHQARNDRQLWPEQLGRTTSGNAPAGLTEVSPSEQFPSRLPASVELYGGTASSHLPSSKSPMMAPPGFSSVRASAIPPPGFSQHKATDLRRVTEASHDPPRSLAPTSSFNHLEAANNSADVEFIDPAIMAVGKGKFPAGSRTAVPLSNSPSLSAFLSQTGPLSQQPRPPLDFESNYQAHQDRSYRNYGSMNSTSHLGYANQDLDTSSSSLFHSSFNDAMSQSRLMGHYHDAVFPNVVMQESVYANGGHSAPKLRFQHSSSDDWSRLSEMNAAGQQSVNDAVGRLAMSQISLDRVLQNRLEELSLSKDLSSKYYGDAAIPTGYDEQGPLSSARIGRYF